MTKTRLTAIASSLALAAVVAGTTSSVTAALGYGARAAAGSSDPQPACSDAVDNDGDLAIDTADPDCSDPLDADEAAVPPPGGAPGAGPPAPPNLVPGNGKPGQHKGGSDKKHKEPPPKPPRGGGFAPPGSITEPTIPQFGPAPIGVPNFVIDQFEIPPFLLPIYQACGTEYGIPWPVLASINRIETAFGTNLNVSSAGALGWMQFIPSSWRAYGVDANDDGRKDPYNPVDAICAAARYLKAAGGADDLRGAIFAYNHADWYVDEVLLYANEYARLPDDLIGSLTGLTEGAHFPVAAQSRYAGEISERRAVRRSKTKRAAAGNAADVIASSSARSSTNIFARRNAPIVAVNDGVVERIGESPKLGRFIVLRDAYGNRYTYARLGEVAKLHPVPKARMLRASDFKLITAAPDDPAPSRAAASGGRVGAADHSSAPAPRPVNTEELRSRLYALPERPGNIDRAGATGQLDALPGKGRPGYETFRSRYSGALEFDGRTMELRELKLGSKVSGGTVLGRIGPGGKLAPHVSFSIRPAGRGAPQIDPKPILDGWRLLETTAIYRATGQDPFGTSATIGQILLMSKTSLERRALADPRLEIYGCGRLDIRIGQIDRRVLAALSYLAERGYRLSVTSLRCGHSFLTSAGNVSAHSSGNAVDISTVNGIPILGNQGRGSVTEAVIRDLLKLQGAMKPAQIISLINLADPSFSLADHADHIHVGYLPPYDPAARPGALARVLKPGQWGRLVTRLGEIENPNVRGKPSRFALPTTRRGGGD